VTRSRKTLCEWPQENGHDPHAVADDPRGPAACPDCHAVLEEGKWHWADVPARAAAHRCPACRRIHDRLPAGIVTLSGPFLHAHRDGIMATVRPVCDFAYLAHPLERMMEIDEDNTEIRIMTTSAHLARAIGRAVQEAWQGDLELDARAEGVPHVAWRR
jgi:hypothetical protein